MNKINFLILFLCLFTVITFAQQKKYISYVVKEGETIKSIARDYDLSTKDLLRLNPDVSRNVKPNTVIIVPNKNYGKEEFEVQSSEAKFYIVKPKETVYGISKMFGITIEELTAANLALDNGLKIGMELVIPEPSAEETKDNYMFHSVVKDDTLYNLSKRYNVTEAELLSLNPSLSDGLKLGMLLKIKPINNTIIENEVVNEEGVFKERLDLHKKMNVVLLLPYLLEKLTDSTANESFKKNNSLLNIATDFHLGAAMAIDSLKRKGLTINATYLDSENSNYKLQNLVKRNVFNEADVVIGPLYFENAYWLSQHIDIPVIAPLFSKNETTLSSDNLVKASPQTAFMENKLFDYLEGHYNGENIIVINDGKPESQSKLWKIVNKLKTFNLIKNVSVVKPENGYIGNGKISEKLKATSNNWVLLVSDENVTTAAAVNNLKSFVENFKITLFALDKGKNFDNIDNNLLGKLNFVFPASEFMNVNDTNVKRFYEKYQAKNYAIPSKYSIRGFDVTYDALVRFASSKNLKEGLQAGKSSRVASIFNYENKEGSFENKGVFLIQYTPDLMPIILE